MAYEVGALANIEETSEDDGKFTYNIYKQKSVDPTKQFDFGPFSLSDFYGSAIMPSLQWVTKIKTGEVVYDPANEQQDKLLKDYEAYIEKNGQIEGLPSPNEIMKQEMAPVLGQLAEGVGSSIATGGTFYEGLPFTTTGLKIAEGTSQLGDISKLNISKVDANKLTALAKQSGEIATPDAVKVLGSKEAITEAGGVVGRDLSGGGVLGGGEFLDNLNPFGESGAGMQNLKSAAGGAVGNFVVQLALGQDPVRAAKSAGAGAIGKMLGTAVGGPIGGFIGGALGSILGGRVICNELMRQGLLTRKEVILDYRFTRDYLTPTHVNGYHVWAVWMVKQMRKGKFVKFWKHVAGHRANEIAYIYGQRDTPDYLGKVYRKILEPTCWVVGSFCKVTDWSVLYKQKEI